jgi:sterol desaturase/sphingolipid hydroxylase (fatty acid hydroxylase superfamily)
LSSALPVLAAFLLIGAAEIAWPWRPTRAFAAGRWVNHLALLVLSTGLDFVLAPVIAIAALTGASDGLPLWVQLVVGVPALDALSYALHRAFHANAILWRLHALHHTDPEVDVSTTVRHHPGEALLIACSIGVLGAAIGLSPRAIGLYSSLNLTVQFFAHANIEFPAGVADHLGWLVVTPALHRVHHSRRPAELATNYGLVFTVWDRLLGTYRSEPENGEAGIEFGIGGLREPYYQRFDRMLWLPFVVRESV